MTVYANKTAADADGPIIHAADAATVAVWLNDSDAVLVDVRETEEYAGEHIAGAILSPLSMFEPDRFPAFAGKRVVLLCAVGKRSLAAAKQLGQVGYTGQIVNLTGGLAAWKEAGFATVTGS